MVLEYEMRVQTGPGAEALQELSWLQSTSDSSSLLPLLVSERLFQKDFQTIFHVFSYLPHPSLNQCGKKDQWMPVLKDIGLGKADRAIAFLLLCFLLHCLAATMSIYHIMSL
jgi:hypothetical protein